MPSDSSVAQMKRATLLLGDLERALQRLADVLQRPEDEFIRDAAAVSTAWRNGWIGDEAAWLDMLDDRNKTSHTYRETIAREVFRAVARHLPRLNELYRALVTRVGEIETQTRQGPAI